MLSFNFDPKQITVDLSIPPSLHPKQLRVFFRTKSHFPKIFFFQILSEKRKTFFPISYCTAYKKYLDYSQMYLVLQIN